MKEVTGLSYMRMAYEKTLHPSLFLHKKQYCGCIHEYKPNLDNPKLFLKGLKIVKRNTSAFYKLIAEEMIWSSLGFIDNQISEQDTIPKQIVIDIITENIKEVRNLDIETFKLTGKNNPSDERITIKDYLKQRDMKNKKPAFSKKGNKMMIDFVANMEAKGIIIQYGRLYYYVIKYPDDSKWNKSKKMIEYSYFNPKNHKLDIAYYFNSLIDICVGLMRTDEKKVKEIIEQIDREHNDERLTGYKRKKKNNEYEIITRSKRQKNKEPSLIELKQSQLEKFGYKRKKTNDDEIVNIVKRQKSSNSYHF
jgi:DNA polymerase family B